MSETHTCRKVSKAKLWKPWGQMHHAQMVKLQSRTSSVSMSGGPVSPVNLSDTQTRLTVHFLMVLNLFNSFSIVFLYLEAILKV